MRDSQYDVVIVGTGIAGAVLAKSLTQAGKRVLMLEAGLQAGLELDAESAFANYQSYVDTFHYKANPATNGPYPALQDAPTPNVLDIALGDPMDQTGYLVQMGPLAFGSDCLRTPGGTTLHWLGNVPRMLPNDFRMQTLYGRGVDWPISYDELKPYYELAELEIGVSGDAAAQVGPDMGRANYGAGYVFPMQAIPQSYQDKVWIRNAQGAKVRVDGADYDVSFISMPQGRNSTPNPDYPYSAIAWEPASQRFAPQRVGAQYQVIGSTWSPYTGERCEGNASCVPLCPVQAKYNALKTLKQADRSRLTIHTQAVASKVRIDPQSRRVTGIEYKRYQKPDAGGYTNHTAEGTLYVLAANALENAKLLLMSGAANSSDQVGRNLMDHQVMLTWGLFKHEKVYPYRGPGCTTYIPTFRDGAFRKDFSAWISPVDNWGWSWPVFSPGSDLSDGMNKGLFGKALRAYLADRVPRQALLHFECEQLPRPENRITIDERFLDRLGNPRPVIHYSLSDYELRAFAAAKEASDQIFAQAQIKDYTHYPANEGDQDVVQWQGKTYQFWGAGHIVGTHRMGSEAASSVVKPTQQTWDHDNLYLVGCGNMPTLGTSNPTLTLTALAFMAAENILKQLDSPSRQGDAHEQ
ncbi:GMC family oxidoreductase [Chromobacterium subtsugae]|uniref:GMC family oxidoreductase n=1 Tax=Chromobacterium subtsugae TaxID=251747 RepID=UPI0007F8ED4F|nr:GMC family oxidoreductase [Chromobacterium subtsugae]